MRPLLVLQERDRRDAAIAAGALSRWLLAARRLLRPIMLWAIMLWAIMLWAVRTLRLLRPAMLWLLTVAVAMMMVVRLCSASP